MRCLATITLLLLIRFSLFAQEITGHPDSIYKQAMVLYQNGEVAKAIPYFRKVIDSWNQTDSSHTINSLSNMGRCLADLGRKEEAWAVYHNALRLAQKYNKQKGQSYIYVNMGILEEEQGNIDKSLEYYQKGLEIAEKINDPNGQVYCLEAISIAWGGKNDFVKARENLLKALSITEKAGISQLTISLLNNIASAEKSLKNYTAAEEYLMQSVNLCKKQGNYAFLLASAAELASIRLEQHDPQKALQVLESNRQYVDSTTYLQTIVEYYQALEEAASATGDFKVALESSKMFHTLQDSIFSNEQKAKITELNAKYEVAKKDLEISVNQQTIARQRIIQWALLLGLLLVGISAWLWYRAFKQKSKLNREIRAEKKRSDELLLNILPASVADELKRNNRVEARLFEQVTVICTDFQNFTSISESLSPGVLVELLDEYFKAFDIITTKYHIEKIKTMGDAYMCAGGLPDPALGSPADTLSAALEMRDVVMRMRREKQSNGLPWFSCRIGLHTGPVIAGVVGSKKFVYDIWGDTVNTATRLEQYGSVDKVNISEKAYQILKANAACRFEYRGLLEVKGKGSIGMYFAE